LLRPGGRDLALRGAALLSTAGRFRMAEGEGFEPPVTLRPHMISSHAHSTGLCQPSDRASNEGGSIGAKDAKVKGLRHFSLHASACLHDHGGGLEIVTPCVAGAPRRSGMEGSACT
jgi:hypothetical protein